MGKKEAGARELLRGSHLKKSEALRRLKEENRKLKEDSRSLFSPIKIGNLNLKNRTIMAPMATGFATEDGQPTKRQIQHYLERARGGVGLIVVEGSAISAEGRSAINRLGLYDDHQTGVHQELVKALHSVGTPVCAQLHHAGAVAPASISGQFPVSCSAVPLFSRAGSTPGNTPRRLSERDIQELVTKFSDAALRAKTCGYDAVMVHAGHGYLIHQFLSPHKNRRRDRYGGTEQNRARFLIEVVGLIRKRLGSTFPVLVRLPGEDRLNGGCTRRFIQRVAQWLENAGVAEISISAGSKDEGEEKTFPSAVLPEGFLAEDARAVKDVVRVPVGVVGRIMSAQTAEMILQEGDADLVYLGRSLIADPYFVKKVEEGREEEIRPCIVCNRCIDRLRTGSSIKCSVNPAVGQEPVESGLRVKDPKTVLVVGGGPAGMEAARTAASRGHRVFLFEKLSQLGGNLKNAILLPHKEQIAKLITYYSNELRSLGVTVSLGKEVTRKLVEKLRPEVLVLASGAEPIPPGIAGSRLEHVLLAEDFLRNPTYVGSKVAVIGGGMIGLEVAGQLAEMGKEVVVIEQLGSLAGRAAAIVRKELVAGLCEKNVKILINTRAMAIGGAGVLVGHAGERTTLNADTVILASGYRPVRDLTEHLDVLQMGFYAIGDCLEPRTILEAIEEGHLTGCAMS